MDETIRHQMSPYSADILNPFVHTLHLTKYKKIMAIIMSFTIFPLRIALAIIILMISSFLTALSLYGIPNEVLKEKPLKGWRRYYMKPFIVFLCRVVFAICGWNWIKVKGKKATPKEAPIFVIGPHSSYFDTIPLVILGCPCLVVKDSTKDVPFFGTLIRFTQPVFVKRDDPLSRDHTLQEIKKRCQSDDNWEQIAIFSEATCSNRKSILPFKLGAFLPGVPVQPVLLKYHNKYDTITWTWDGPGALKQFWLSLCQFNISLEMEYLPVYKPNEAEKKNPMLFAENVRNTMARALNVPATKFAMDDIKYLFWAKEYKLPKTIGISKLLKLRHKVQKSPFVMDEIIFVKQKLKGKTKQCTLDELADLLEYEKSSLKDFFDICNQEAKERIDPKIYIAGLWLINTDISQVARLKSALNLFKENNSEVSCEGFSAVLFLYLGMPRHLAVEFYNQLKSTNYIHNYNKFKEYTFSKQSDLLIRELATSLNGSCNHFMDKPNAA